MKEEHSSAGGRSIGRTKESEMMVLSPAVILNPVIDAVLIVLISFGGNCLEAVCTLARSQCDVSRLVIEVFPMLCDCFPSIVPYV